MGKKVSTDFLFKFTGFEVKYFEVVISLYVSMHYRKKLVYYIIGGGCYRPQQIIPSSISIQIMLSLIELLLVIISSSVNLSCFCAGDWSGGESK